MIKELVSKTRSVRRFRQGEKISGESLRELVELARLSASASNRQPLKFMLSCEPGKNAVIFRHLAWAGALKNWGGPAEGERPAAYIIILGDTRISKDFGVDHGIAAQSIVLGAREKGYGACMVGSIKREELRQSLAIAGHLEILLVLALGVPAETVVLEDAVPGGPVTYYRDEKDSHHVPKRTLEELIVGG